MYDPMTVAFEIKSLFGKRWPMKDGSPGEHVYRETLITIWHKDPELHGDDDSCGWAYVNLTHADREWAAKEAKDEWKFWFAEEHGSINLWDSDDHGILAAAWNTCRFYATPKTRHTPLKAWELSEITGLLSCSGDNFIRHCRRARESADGLEELLLLVLRIYKTRIRPWYKKPRWHVRHWQIQVHVVQKFNRWAFSRCAGCGGRFAWGESPTSFQWGGGGPRFLRGEKGKYHHKCATKQFIEHMAAQDEEVECNHSQ